MAHILVVSDTPNLRQSLAGILQHAGFGVYAASPGDMPQILLTQPVDLLMFELRIPYESGLRVLASVCSVYKVPAVVLSSAAYPRIKQRALFYGAAAFLLKPIDPPVIVQCVQTIVDQRQSGQVLCVPPRRPPGLDFSQVHGLPR